MQNRYGYFKRVNGVYYALDLVSKSQTSLRTRDEAEATRLIAAKNQTADTPQLNRAMAKVYAAAAHPELMERTWREVMDAYIEKSSPKSKGRVDSAFRGEPFQLLVRIKVNETDSKHFGKVFQHERAGNSTNHYLRRLQNYALGMRWLFEPVIPSPFWPKVKKKKTVAVSEEEHAKILASELNPEHHRYYSMLWETGGSQSDIAKLTWNRIARQKGTITFYRDKLDEREEDGQICGLTKLVMGPRILAILAECPQSGPLFPCLRQWKAAHRSTEFARRCRIAGIEKRQLKGYRYSWAQRASASGMPLREAMNHLGHKSRAVHEAYAEDAIVVTLPLEHYEQEKKKKIVAFQATAVDEDESNDQKLSSSFG